MKLTVFQSDKGDCLLLSDKDGTHMLIDGGMRQSYRDHAAETLHELRKADKKLDLVYVSHIDEDHISGVLQMLDDVVAWRVYNYRKEKNLPAKEPEFPWPPDIMQIWHNAFDATLDDDDQEEEEDGTANALGPRSSRIQEMLAQTAPILSRSQLQQALAEAEQQQEVATGVRQAIQLSNRISKGQLGIPLNEPYGGNLMLVKEGMPKKIKLGRMSIFVIGPSQEDLDKLKQDWDEWLQTHEETLRRLARDARVAEENLRANEVDAIIKPALMQADELGRREKVTAPNLASLMLLVEEDGKTILLTGDGHWSDILKGLDHHKKLRDGRLHVDVMKVPHHGSENNISQEFCDQVTAEHYVFCGNGAHGNPDPRVIDRIVQSREREGDTRKFTFWFNSSPVVADPVVDKPDKNKEHMKKLAAHVKQCQDEMSGRMTVMYLEGSSFAIEL